MLMQGNIECGTFPIMVSLCLQSFSVLLCYVVMKISFKFYPLNNCIHLYFIKFSVSIASSFYWSAWLYNSVKFWSYALNH